MAGEDRVLANGADKIDFQTDPSRYRHWRLAVDGDVATLTMDVDENGGLFEGYQLKLNSYDLGVDIELADAVQRLRFEHPEVKVGGAALGQGPGVLRRRQHPHAGRRHPRPQGQFLQVHQRDPQRHRGSSGEFRPALHRRRQRHRAGGGYELALAADHIILADDGSSSVSLPEVPLLAVLPGTGGLTRVTDKRKVRRDHADVFCTIEEGVKGKRAVDWRLVDEIAPNCKLEARSPSARKEFAAASKRNGSGQRHRADAARRAASTTAASATASSRWRSTAPRASRPSRSRRRRPPPPADIDGMIAQGAAFWPLQLARELDDAILHLRINELETAMLVFKSQGDAAACAGLRRLPRGQQGALAGPRDPALLEAGAEAHRRDLALAGGAGRARLVLCRHAGRNGVRGRPLLHADRRDAGRQPRRRRRSR